MWAVKSLTSSFVSWEDELEEDLGRVARERDEGGGDEKPKGSNSDRIDLSRHLTVYASAVLTGAFRFQNVAWLSDVAIVWSSGSSGELGRRQWAVHKIVLAARSSKLETLLRQGVGPCNACSPSRCCVLGRQR